MSDETIPKATCGKCGNSWNNEVPATHGWPESTGRVVQEGDANTDGTPVKPEHVGAVVFTFVDCAAATADQVRVYQDARQEIARRVLGGIEHVKVEGTEGHGKEQLEQ
ncbi:MAG TPA: hypothetical protein VM389_03070 [Phycisphaerae bacterium]|nr:hypothetical protein [Phycisphaerae bacterium]HUU60152.1 hypothetical protein [Phycisphaerae bacterium]